MERQSANTNVTTDPSTVLVGVTYDPAETSITATIFNDGTASSYCFEIVNGSNVVQRRAVVNGVTIDNEDGPDITLTISGLPAETLHICRCKSKDSGTYVAV